MMGWVQRISVRDLSPSETFASLSTTDYRLRHRPLDIAAIHVEKRRELVRVETRARPAPSQLVVTQSSSYRVSMDVVDACPNRLRAEEVAIVSRSRLPEGVASFGVARSVSQQLQSRGRFDSHAPQNCARNRAFYVSADGSHAVFLLHWMDDR